MTVGKTDLLEDLNHIMKDTRNMFYKLYGLLKTTSLNSNGSTNAKTTRPGLHPVKKNTIQPFYLAKDWSDTLMAIGRLQHTFTDIRTYPATITNYEVILTTICGTKTRILLKNMILEAKYRLTVLQQHSYINGLHKWNKISHDHSSSIQSCNKCKQILV